MSTKSKTKLTTQQSVSLLSTLKARFEKNMNRHEGVVWEDVETRLQRDPAKLWSIHEMEQTGGEPDVVGHDKAANHFAFYDCSLQLPRGEKGPSTTVRGSRVSRNDKRLRKAVLNINCDIGKADTSL